VTENITDAKACLEQDNLGDFYREAQLLSRAIHHIRDQERLCLSNLF